MKKFILLSLMLVSLPLTMMAQDDDDMYFVPTKKQVEKDKARYQVPRDVYYSGINRSVDEYNRRTPAGSYYEVLSDSTANDIISFDGQLGVYPDSTQQDFQITREMSRWDGYDPGDSYWAGYKDGRRDGARSWHSPWYYSSFYPWYDPWYWDDPWYYGYRGWYSWYDPWYYGWYGYTPWYYYGHYSWFSPWYGSYGVAYNGPTGTERHGRINYNGVRGFSNGRSTTYSAGTFGGSSLNRGTFGNRSGASGSRSTIGSASRSGRTSNEYGNFGGARTRSNAQSSSRSYTPSVSTTTSNSSYSSSSSSRSFSSDDFERR